MDLLVLSDSHGDEERVRAVLARERKISAVLFLGDGLRDIEWISAAYPGLPVYSVRGNCDGYGSFAPTEGLAPFAGLLVFYTHGHLYQVKTGLYDLADAASARGAQIALYGHTHLPAYQVLDGIHLFNPGALSYSRTAAGGSYGKIHVENGVPSFAHDVLP